MREPGAENCLLRVGVDPPQEERREHCAGELHEPVGHGEHHRQAPRDQERERDSRVEVSARDVAEGRDHDTDDEPEGERDLEIAGARIGPGSQIAPQPTNERERPDELGD